MGKLNHWGICKQLTFTLMNTNENESERVNTQTNKKTNANPIPALLCCTTLFTFPYSQDKAYYSKCLDVAQQYIIVCVTVGCNKTKKTDQQTSTWDCLKFELNKKKKLRNVKNCPTPKASKSIIFRKQTFLFLIPSVSVKHGFPGRLSYCCSS